MPLSFASDLAVEPHEPNVWLRDAVERALGELREREQCVIRARWFNDLTLAEIAALMSISTERVRQIEAKALRKLRHPSRSRKFFSYRAAA